MSSRTKAKYYMLGLSSKCNNYVNIESLFKQLHTSIKLVYSK